MNLKKYIVIHDTGVYISRDLKRLNQKLKTSYRIEDFTTFGYDCVLYSSKEDITYQRDLHYLSQIPMSNLFKVDKRPLIFGIINFIFTLFIFLQIVSVRGYIAQIVKLVGG